MSRPLRSAAEKQHMSASQAATLSLFTPKQRKVPPPPPIAVPPPPPPTQNPLQEPQIRPLVQASSNAGSSRKLTVLSAALGVLPPPPVSKVTKVDGPGDDEMKPTVSEAPTHADGEPIDAVNVGVGVPTGTSADGDHVTEAQAKGGDLHIAVNGANSSSSTHAAWMPPTPSPAASPATPPLAAMKSVDDVKRYVNKRLDKEVTLSMKFVIKAGCLLLAVFVLLVVIVWLVGSNNRTVQTVEVLPEWGRFEDETVGTLWSYEAGRSNGPHNWGIVRNATTGSLLYPACADTPASTQSPINIKDPDPSVSVVPGSVMLERSYTVNGSFSLVPRPGGHPGFQLKPSDGATAQWIVDGLAYDLIQFHFHSPSEHLINGERYPLEVHFVHQNADTKGLAVFGILYHHEEETETPNRHLRSWWDEIYYPHQLPVSNPINLSGMISDITGNPHTFYRYTGSLTTPPCSEGVRWFVARAANGINTAQRITYQYSVHLIENYRPIQPLHGRVVSKHNP